MLRKAVFPSAPSQGLLEALHANALLTNFQLQPSAKSLSLLTCLAFTLVQLSWHKVPISSQLPTQACATQPGRNCAWSSNKL